MASDVVTCPYCNKEFSVTSALSAQIEGRVRESITQEQEKLLADQKLKLELELTKKNKEYEAAFQRKLNAELENQKEILRARDQELDEARKNELKLRQLSFEL
jgi:hypothetical protein